VPFLTMSGDADERPRQAEECGLRCRRASQSHDIVSSVLQSRRAGLPAGSVLVLRAGDAFAKTFSFISSVALRRELTFSRARADDLVRMPHVTMDSFSGSEGWWKDQDYLYATSRICLKS